MPVMDGVEATKVIKQHLRQLNMDTSIIAHTAMPEEQFRNNAHHFDGFLPKPVSSDILRKILL